MIVAVFRIQENNGDKNNTKKEKKSREGLDKGKDTEILLESDKERNKWRYRIKKHFSSAENKDIEINACQYSDDSTDESKADIQKDSKKLLN